MKTPEKVPLLELRDVLEQQIQMRYAEDPFGGLRCRRCGLPVHCTTAHFSLHFMENPCAGPGTVTTRPLPYCRECEGEPRERDAYGCAHLEWQPGEPAVSIAGRS